MSVEGVDYAWGRPGTAALQKAGKTFAARYLSYDTTGKNLTRSEAAALSRAGIWIVVVWEQTASRVLGGKTAGSSDAREALRQAKVCGMPDDRPIYFAVDFAATAGQQPTINAYLDGAADVLGRERVGLYGGYGPIKRAFDAGKIAYGWQTYAWSGGKWDPRAQLQQYSNDHRINGVGLDYDRAVKDDYGQWKVGESPMALSKDDLKAIAEAVWTADIIPSPPWVAEKGNANWQASSYLHWQYRQGADTQAAVAALAKDAPQVDTGAIIAGILAGLTPDAIAEKLATALPDDLAKQVVDALAARLQDGGQ